MKKLAILRHNHRHGVDIHPAWVAGEPTKDELQQALIKAYDIDFEPDRDESIEIDYYGDDMVKIFEF